MICQTVRISIVTKLAKENSMHVVNAAVHF